MNIVDSSGWLEYFADGGNADFFSSPIEKTADLIVPTISIYEVFKRILQQKDEAAALQAIALMHQGRVVNLDAPQALEAARLSQQLKLPMADSIMLAAARNHHATLWTQDADFQQVPGVRYIVKAK